MMEHVRSSLTAKGLHGEARTVVFHAEEDWLKRIRDGQVDFFVKLTQRLTREGVATRLAALGGHASKVLLGQGHMHIIVGRHPAYGRNLLHAHPAYIWGFWYLNETGINWNSTLRFAQFVPDQVDAEKAEYFFNGMTSYMLRENVSRLPQEARATERLPDAAAVIYCQEIEDQTDRSHYLTTEQMIRTTAETRRGDLVHLKLHPEQSKSERRRILSVAADYQNVKFSDASVHDLSAAARVVVTQNSAAGFEALMQRKPVITCARSDFWHATLTPHTPADLADAVNFGPEAMAGFDFAKYLYWFLDRNCLEPQKEEFAARAWSRIREKAFF